MADPLPIRIRTFRSEDATAVRVLYEEGLLGGQIAENDTGLDLDDVEAAYLDTGFGHFWVAVNEAGRVIGTIGVQSHEEGVGEIRRLRVHPECRRRGVGSRLLEQAIRFCRSSNFLKIMLDTHMEQEPAIKLFEKFQFRHGRTRDTNGKQLLVFYLDLYSDDG
ncbi:MAG: GNAT family N-acetyltransferase [Planctomycetota bacterium]